MGNPGYWLTKTGTDPEACLKVAPPDRQEGRASYPIGDAGVESLQRCIVGRKRPAERPGN